jgi:hypothetical protein
MLIESSGTALSVILFFMLPALLHWLSKRRFLRSSLDPRADILLPNWERGQPAAMDVTVISSLQPLTLSRGCFPCWPCPLCWGASKDVSSCPRLPRCWGLFHPLAFEALGSMSEATTTSLSRIGRILGQRLGVSPAVSIRHLFQRCSVSLWRGNAALWLHRFPIDSII